MVDQAPRLVGEPLNQALGDVATGLSGLGITGVTDAGDPTTSNGYGRYAQLGDSFSSLADAQGAFERRLRVTVNLPAVSGVQVLVNGKEVDTLAGHVDLRRPLAKNLAWVQ